MGKGKVERRGTRRRQIKPVILIVAEGSQTEPKYFEQFRTRQTNIDIQVVGSRAGGNTDYMSLVRKAIEHIDKKQLSASNGDAMWVVADGDINYAAPAPVVAKNNQLDNARKLANKSGIQIAISNPCFEFWYLLHFRYTTGFLPDYTAVSTALKAHIPDYTKIYDVTKILEPIIDAAIAHAERVEAYHVANGETLPLTLNVNPFTDVFKLVKTLR